MFRSTPEFGLSLAKAFIPQAITSYFWNRVNQALFLQRADNGRWCVAMVPAGIAKFIGW